MHSVQTCKTVSKCVSSWRDLFLEFTFNMRFCYVALIWYIFLITKHDRST